MTRTIDSSRTWRPGERILFRFVCAYFLLFITPLSPFWQAVVPWVGRHLFQVDASPRSFAQSFCGSGDTTYHYVQVFCLAVLAGAVAAVWSALDRQRRNYERVHEWFRVILRYVLAAAMFVYGGGKVIPDQFPAPSLENLTDTFGDTVPVTLLWTFMGASASYTVFTGVAEMVGGLLLTCRRTTLLGALICIGVLSNVVMLNFSYDVPVKLLSSHLLAMAVVLAAPDLRRLADLFLFNRPVEPVVIGPLFPKPWLNRAALLFRTVFVAALIGLSLWESYDNRSHYGDWAPRPPLYGIWLVNEFESDGTLRPPLLTDPDRWRRVIFPQSGPLVIQLMDETRRRYSLDVKAAYQKLTLTRSGEPGWKAEFSYAELEPGLITLEGNMDGRMIRTKLRRVDETKFPLVSRGFRWVSG